MAIAAPEQVVSKKPEAEEEPPATAVMEKPNDVVQEKPVALEPHDDAKAPAKVPERAATKGCEGSLDRNVALAKLEDEKRQSFIKAWEESEKSKVQNKAQKKLAEVSAWESSKKASLESQLKKLEVSSPSSSNTSNMPANSRSSKCPDLKNYPDSGCDRYSGESSSCIGCSLKTWKLFRFH